MEPELEQFDEEIQIDADAEAWEEDETDWEDGDPLAIARELGIPTSEL